MGEFTTSGERSALGVLSPAECKNRTTQTTKQPDPAFESFSQAEQFIGGLSEMGRQRKVNGWKAQPESVDG
jgi:hypothetical protein